MATCLIKDCERNAKTRGLCDPCYQSALTAVKKRKVTWDQLIDLGLAKPATKVSIKGAGLFSVALAAKKALLSERPAPVDTEPLPESAPNDIEAGRVMSTQGVPDGLGDDAQELPKQSAPKPPWTHDNAACNDGTVVKGTA